MNKKKLKSIIALTLTLSYLNSTCIECVKAFPNVLSQTQQASVVEYQELIKSNLNLQSLSTATCNSSSNNLVDGNYCISNTKESFKVFLAENGNGFSLAPTITSDKNEFLLPTSSFLNEKSLTLTPSQDIETLSLFFKSGQPISYSNLKKDYNYKLSSIDNVIQPDYVLIKYEGDKEIYKQVFSLINDTTVPSISNIKKAYTIDSSKQTVRVSWEESDDHKLDDVSYKKVFFNNTLLDVIKSNSYNSYYCDIDITSLTANNTINILTCDYTYQINDQSVSFDMPKFDYRDVTLTNADIKNGKYSIDFPFTNDIKNVTVKSQTETFNLDAANKTANISIPNGGTYDVTFKITLNNDDSYTINKKYFYDDKELILNNTAYQTKIYKQFNNNLTTDTAVIPCIINNNDTIYYDGKTIEKNRYEFPLSISGNKNLENISITVNGNVIINNGKDFNPTLNLNPGTNLISVTATDNSGYVTNLNFTVEVANDDYNFNLSSNAKLTKTADTSYELNSSKICDLNAELTAYPDDLDKAKLKLEAFDSNKRTLSLIDSIEHKKLSIKSIPSNCSSIKINYLDKFNRLVTSDISVNIDTSNPIINNKTNIPNFLNTSDLNNLNYIIEVQDNSLSKTRAIKKTSDFSSTIKNTFCYQLLDEANNPLALTLSDDKITQHTYKKNLSIDFSSAIKSLNLSDGKYTLKCKYIDNTNNLSNEYSKTFVIDTTTPNIKADLVNPLYKEPLYKDSISIKKDSSSLSFNDNKVISIEDTNLDSFDYKIYKLQDNSKLEVTDSTLSTSGNYVLYASCKDKAGNENKIDGIKFSLDCDAAKITADNNVANFTNGKYYYKNGSFVLNFDDNYMNFNTSIYSSTDTNNNNSVYASLTSSLNNSVNLFDKSNCVSIDAKQLKFDVDELKLQDGEYNLSVKIIDKVGHVTTADYTIIVDRLAPNIKTNELCFKDKGTTGSLNYYLFNKSVTINTTTSKFQRSNNNNFNISIDEANFKKGNITILKLKPNSKPEEIENTDLNTLSIDKYLKILTDGVYTIKYSFEDIVGNKTEHSINLAVVSTPKVTLGYLDTHGNFISLTDVKYINNNFSPVVKVDGLLGGKLKQYNITRTYLDNSNVLKTEEFNETNIVSSANINEYGEVYYKLGSNTTNAFKFINLNDGEIKYNFTFSNFFNEDVTLNNEIFIEKELPYVSVTLNDLPTENQVNYINTTPKFKINIAKNYSSLNANGLQFIIKKLNADGSQNDVSHKFESIALSSDNYHSEFEIKLKQDTTLDENGVYIVCCKTDTNAGNSIVKRFNFSYDTASPSYSIKAINNGNETNFNMDSSGNCFNKNKDTSLKFEFDDNSFKFNQLLAGVSNLSNKVIVKKANSNEIVYDSININSNSIIIDSNIFSEGCYDITIESTDSANNVLNKTIKYYLDYTKPSIELKNVPISTKESTYYFKDDFKPNFVITDATPLDTITINYNINGIQYNSSADKFNEDLLEKINQLKKNILSPNEYKFDLVINGQDKAGNAFFAGGEEFKCRLVLDSNSPKTTISVNDTDITGNKDKIFASIPDSIKLAVNDSNLNIDNIKNDFKVRYLGTISNDPQKDILSSSVVYIKLDYDDSIKGYTATIPYCGDGYYYIETSAKDNSENSEGTVGTFFTIDTTAVNSKVESNDGSFYFSKKHYNDTINFSLNVAGHYSGFKNCEYSLIKDGIDVTKDYLTGDFKAVQKGGNISFSLPKNTSIEGNYTFKYSIVGNVGGKVEDTINFVIDKTAPTLSDFNLNMGNGKVVNNIFYTNASTTNIKFNASDKYTDASDLIKTVTINGANYTLSDTSVPNNYVSTDGRYTLSFSLTDVAGNTSSYNYDIILDRVAPTLDVSGFNGSVCPEDQEFYINQNITPQISVTDTNGEDLAARTILLDNSTYTSSTISNNGKHSYKVKVNDYAGNTSEFEKTFILDTVFPAISISDVINNNYYNKDVLPKFTVDDVTAKLSAYLNNSSYDGSAIGNDGVYELVITAIDRASNKTEIKIPFTIDKIAPIITIKGILENQVNGGSVTPLITVNEAQALITSLLNGEEYLGFVITDSGKYNLIVRAIDLAGNTAQKVVSFIVDSSLPQITVEGLEDGKVYTSSIKPIITASKDAKIELFLNGKPYDGSEIKDIGEYELKIIATDKVSNKSEVVYKFSITTEGNAVNSTNTDNTNNKNTNSAKGIKGIFTTAKALPLTVGAIAVIIILFILLLFINKRKKLSKVNNKQINTEK